MIADIQTMMWKEWKELVVQRGRLRGGLLSLLVMIAFFSVILPLQHGDGWTESPFVLLISGWLPFFLVTHVVADSFAGERERHTLETLLASRLPDKAILLGKVLAAIGYGWSLLLLILFLELVTVNLLFGQGEFIFYEGMIVFGSVALSLLGSGFAASIGVLISLRASTVRQAQQILSSVAMALMVVPFVVSQVLSQQQKSNLIKTVMSSDLSRLIIFVIVVLAVLDIGLLIVSMVKFRRAHLILS